MANDVEIKIKLDTAGAQASIKQLNAVLDKLSESLSSGTFEALNKALATFGSNSKKAQKAAADLLTALDPDKVANFAAMMQQTTEILARMQAALPTDQVTQMGAAMNRTGQSARALNTNTTQTASGFSVLAQRILTAYASIGILQASFGKLQEILTATVGKAITFEYELAKIQTVISDNTKATAELAPQINKLTQEFGQSRSDVAKTYFDVIASGAVEASKATYIVTEAQRLATASFVDSSTAGTALLSTLTAYNMDATQAARVSDVLFSAMKDGRIRMTDFANGMGQVSPMAALLGVKLEELSGGISALSLITREIIHPATRNNAAVEKPWLNIYKIAPL
jgi:hypothetical protein